MITCKDLIELIDEWRTAALPEASRREFLQHLAACPPCVRYLETYEQTIALARGAEPAAEPELPDDLVQAILDARRRA